LGVLGGAYNPITVAHLSMADAAVRAFDLHEMLFLLPEVPPHKTIFGASLSQRLEMMQLAVEDCPYASVGLSTHGLFIDIYQALQEIYPSQSDVFFVTGRDAAERILSWNYADAEAALHQMLTSFQLIICDREGAFNLPDNPLLAPYQARMHRCPLAEDLDQISSTVVRQRCVDGLPLEGFVPSAVARYIEQQQLYLA
jgi:nicotinate (nicotinamide) nucleotide adenylyltransferase